MTPTIAARLSDYRALAEAMAYEAGGAASRMGRDRSSCPYREPSLVTRWLNGWDMADAWEKSGIPERAEARVRALREAQ